MKRMMSLISGALALGVVLSACTSYDREEWLQEYQTEAGLDEATSVCIVDGLEAELGEDKLGGRASSLTDEDEAVMLKITTDCLLGG